MSIGLATTTRRPAARYQHSHNLLLLAAAIVAGLLAFSITVLMRNTIGLTGWKTLVLTAMLLVLIPTTRSFSGRVLFSLTILAGASPLIWWFYNSDIPYLNRGTFLISFAAGVFVGCCVYWFLSKRALRDLLPTFKVVDAYPLLAGLVGIVVSQYFLLARNFDSAMSLMADKWDFAPHFNMFNMLRNHGSVIAQLPLAPDGSTWSAATYPQGFHAFMATLAELVTGTRVGNSVEEVILFSNLVGVVSVLTVVLVVSSLTALPVFRNNALLALPFATLVATLWIVGPGSIPEFGAFQNFSLSVALCIAALAIVQLRDSTNHILVVASFAAALIGVAHGWVLLLVFCVPTSILMIYFILKRRSRASIQVFVVYIALGLLAIFGCLLALWQLKSLSPGDVLTTTGGIELPDWGIAVVSVISYVFILLALYRRWKSGSSDHRRHTLSTILVLAAPILATGLTITLAVFQLISAGTLTYYFYKSALAVEIVAIFCVSVGAMELWSRSINSRTRHRNLLIAQVFLAGIGATQIFGFPITSFTQSGLVPTAQGSVALERQRALLTQKPLPQIEKLAEMTRMSPDRAFVYAGYNKGFDPQLAAQWSLTLQGKWTEASQKTIPYLRPLYNGPSKVPEAVKGILENVPGILVAIDQNLVPEMKKAFPWDADRIIGLGG